MTKHRFFKRMFIHEKLIFIITLTSAITLLLAFSAFSISDLHFFYQKQENKLKILSQIMADNCQAALTFNDQKAARELLATLKAEPYIVSAIIYGKDNLPFATYPVTENGDASLRKRIGNEQFYNEGFMHTYWPVTLNGERIGTVYLKNSLNEFHDLIRKYFVYGTLIILTCVGAAFWLASLLQKTISQPILDLAGLAQRVSQQKNYALRAVKKDEDEVGMLMDRFNEMLNEIQKRETALVKFNDALTRSNRELEQFAFVASHDLQEPLRMVSNYSDLLKEKIGKDLDHEGEEFLHYVMDGATRSQQLIADLLNYSRVRHERNPEKVSSDDMLTKALANLKVSIEESGAEITREPLPDVYADPLKLWQVFQNLISNAIKFQNQAKPKIHVSAKRAGDDIIFSVRDNGIGIARPYQEKIFEIFKRLHGRDKYPGTGIGLAICKKIIEQQGGTIWVESELHQGTTFYFTLPVLR